MTKEFILPFAGMVKLEKRTSTGALSTNPADTYISAKDAVKKITRETTVESQPIESGNSFDPVRTRYTKYVQGIGVTLNSFDRQVYRMGTGAVNETTTTGAKAEITEEYEVPSTPFKVVLLYTASSIKAVKDSSTGLAITETTEETISTGTYKFDATTNSVEFNEDMAGISVIINYVAEATETSTDKLSITPTSGVYKVTLFYGIEGLKDGTAKSIVTATYDSLEFKDGLKHPDNDKELSEWSFNMSSVASQGDTKEEVTYTDKENLTVFTPAP